MLQKKCGIAWIYIYKYFLRSNYSSQLYYERNLQSKWDLKDHISLNRALYFWKNEALLMVSPRICSSTTLVTCKSLSINSNLEVGTKILVHTMWPLECRTLVSETVVLSSSYPLCPWINRSQASLRQISMTEKMPYYPSLAGVVEQWPMIVPTAKAQRLIGRWEGAQ